MAESRKEAIELRAVNSKAGAKNKELEDELAKVSRAHDEAVQVRCHCTCHAASLTASTAVSTSQY